MWKGISLHNEVLKMVNQGLKCGEVHSVFNRTINLMTENGHMVSLMAKTMDNAPVSILADVDDFCDCEVFSGERVYFSKEKVTVGAKVLDISGASGYKLDRGTFHADSPLLLKNLDSLRRLMDSNGPKAQYCFDTMAFQMVVHRTALLKQAFIEEDWDELIKRGKSLMGLGQGLTPSGDDVLMGVFLVVGLIHSPMNRCHPLLSCIIGDMVDETTDVSYQGLLRASEGFYRSILTEAAEAMTSTRDTTDILLRVLSIGHSSGRDLLYGIQTGYEIIMEKEKGNADQDYY